MITCGFVRRMCATRRPVASSRSARWNESGCSFGAVSAKSVDPSQKATILAAGISEAMNCTAFGLIVALMSLIGYAILNGKTQQIEDDINEASVQVLNLVIANRQKVNLQGVPQQ